MKNFIDLSTDYNDEYIFRTIVEHANYNYLNDILAAMIDENPTFMEILIDEYPDVADSFL